MFDLVSNNYMIQMMDKGMTLSSRRMGLIATNLANIDTPNYKAQDFSFEQAFRQEVSAMDRQFSPGTPSLPSYFPGTSASMTSIEPEDSSFERNDLNDVSLDKQTMNLATTQNLYQMSSMFAQTELRRLLGAIRDSK